MAREVNTPLVLWICAAVCAHAAVGRSTKEVADRREDRMQLVALVQSVEDWTQVAAKPTEIEVLRPEEDMALAMAEEEKTDPSKSPEETKPDDKPEATLKPEAMPVPPPEPPKVKVEEKKKEEEKKKAEEKKKEEEKKVAAIVPEVKKEEPKPPPPPIAVQPDRRIAVQTQDSHDQTPNPNAHLISDKDNHVKEETQAAITNTEVNQPNPTPGGNHAGPTPTPGNSERNLVRQNEDKKGEHNMAPGDHGDDKHINRDSLMARNANPQPQPAVNGGNNRPQASSPAVAAVQPRPQPPVQQQPTPGGVNRPATPEMTTASNGSEVVPAPHPAVTGQNPNNTNSGPGRSTLRPNIVPTPIQNSASPFGLGMGRFNLNQPQVQAVVGSDALTRMRVADGERRKSEHRGSWTASNFERWRSAIENYVSSVKPGNQTALNTAASPFATYLNSMHNRIHPIFADNFLGSLDALPREHPMNDPKIITRLEIVLNKDGQLQKMGIVKTSGITAFDIAALDSVNRAQPFGPAPNAIISPDGNVYLHWEFHRDEVYACSTMNARPFLLNVKPPSAPTDPTQPPAPPVSPPGPHERGAPPVNTRETQQGSLPFSPGHIHG